MKNIDIGLCGTQHIDRSKNIRKLLNDNYDLLLGSDTENKICFDGIVDERAYSKQQYRLAFLLKETNGNNPDGTQGALTDWDYIAWIRSTQCTNKNLYPAFRNVAMWTSEFYDVFDDRGIEKRKYIENGTLKVTDALTSELSKIAVINLKKTWGGGSTDWNKLNEYLSNQEICRVLREELETAEPTVVLCGGIQVFDFVKKVYAQINPQEQRIATDNGNELLYMKIQDMLFVNFYHPSCRKSREAMFDYAADVFQKLKTII